MLNFKNTNIGLTLQDFNANQVSKFIIPDWKLAELVVRTDFSSTLNQYGYTDSIANLKTNNVFSYDVLEKLKNNYNSVYLQLTEAVFNELANEILEAFSVSFPAVEKNMNYLYSSNEGKLLLTSTLKNIFYKEMINRQVSSYKKDKNLNVSLAGDMSINSNSNGFLQTMTTNWLNPLVKDMLYKSILNSEEINNYVNFVLDGTIALNKIYIL